MDLELIRRSVGERAEFDYARSGGPGGQNVNKRDTKARARVRLALVEGLSEAERALALERLAGRLVGDGELAVSAEDERTRELNRQAALGRLVAAIAKAAKRPKRRVATKPTRASKERRLQSKKTRGETKRLRSSRPIEG
ncbi:MAG: aminoacyl-tRNA hydrolase [Spirochaetia bacterium]|nr:aminoacyl-tRNA hydrolase [Spirochaetia bacterium]